MERSPQSQDTLLAGARRAGEWFLLLIAVSAGLAGVVVPRLAGAVPYAVETGSMRPIMPPGTLVVVQPVDPAEIRIGDVITYLPRQEDPDVITHRVVSQGFDTTGSPTFRTRGDANDLADQGEVHGYQVVGRRWYFVPYLGYVTDLLSGQQRAVAALGLSGGLLLYALAMFAGALRDRLRGPAGAGSMETTRA